MHRPVQFRERFLQGHVKEDRVSNGLRQRRVCSQCLHTGDSGVCSTPNEKGNLSLSEAPAAVKKIDSVPELVKRTYRGEALLAKLGMPALSK
jgi:hypothetical protein